MVKQKSFKKFVFGIKLTIILSLILFILSFTYFIFINNDKTNNDQYYKNETTSDGHFTTITQEKYWSKNILQTNIELFARNKISENFRAKIDDLGTIAIPFNAHNKSVSDEIIFRLKKTGENDWYIQSLYNANQFQTNVPFPFGFPTIKNSKNVLYTFEIESLDGRPGNSVSLSNTNNYFLTKYIFSKFELIHNPSKLIEFIIAKINEKLPILEDREKTIILIISTSPIMLCFLIRRMSMPGTKVAGNISSNKKRSFTRIQWIDVGKGLGLLLVISGHLVKIGSSLAIWIFSFHIPLFFFLSGYVSKITENDGKYSFKKILVSLIVPYFIFCLIGLIVSMIIPAWRPSSAGKIIYEVFYKVDPESLHVGQIWFLFCLAVVEVFFLLFLKLKIRNRYLIFGCIGLSAFLAYAIGKYNIGPLIVGSDSRLPWMIDSAFMGFFFFSFGYYSKLLKIFSKFYSKSTYKNIVLGLLFLMINLYVSIRLNNPVNLSANVYGNLIYFVIASISGVFFVVSVSRLLENNSLLIYMGKNTLSIFSLHSFLLYFYVYILDIILGADFILMTNIPLRFSLIGLFFVSLVSLIIPTIYSNTAQKLILRLK